MAGSALLHNETEVFVVDNASTDGSLDFLSPLFPTYHFIQNKENSGFAKANNQAIAQCRGTFLLFLNPDTILAEDCLEKAISFFRSRSDAGALGVRMVDGSGQFLKESKRGFPGIPTSFFKMTGLARLFPHSPFFASYYLGHLEEGKSHPVDILSGAFLLTQKTVLDKIGDFDEQFFMYGEDIDLCYRIGQAGFQNYYFADTTLIHFKGESTSKDYQYVNRFYTAMILFMKKHFKGSGASLRLFFLSIAVRTRQLLTYIARTMPENKPAPIPIPAIRVLGDPVAQVKWTHRLAEKNIPGITNPKEIPVILFCEGPQWSWKKIIQEISDHPGAAIYLFSGSDTHAAVSSLSSNRQGEVLEF